MQQHKKSRNIIDSNILFLVYVLIFNNDNYVLHEREFLYLAELILNARKDNKELMCCDIFLFNLGGFMSVYQIVKEIGIHRL